MSEPGSFFYHQDQDRQLKLFRGETKKGGFKAKFNSSSFGIL